MALTERSGAVHTPNPKGTMVRSVIAVVGLALAAGPLAAQEAMFVLRAGKDTISLERFTRTATRIDSEVFLKPNAVRLRFSATIGADGLIGSLDNQFWMATDSGSAPARQTAVLTLTGDSAFAAISGGGQTRTERLGSQPGALPYINPSFALIEVFLRRAKLLGGNPAEVPAFMVNGGQTFPVRVATLGADSMVLTMAGGEMRFKVDRDGRILGGAIPAQKATIERTSPSSAGMTMEKPDYSAPAGAPYRAIDVTVTTTMGHTLAGTLTIPAGATAAAPAPAVVTITGSGSQDRDEAISLFKGFRPFREFADSLARRGIAVLRMDDRGFGGSGGDAATATSADFAKDIQAGLAWLRTRPEIDGTRLGLIGHSEGGLIAPMVAKDEPSLKGIVLLAGTAYTGRQILNFQLGNGIKNDTSLRPAARDSALKAVAPRVDSMTAGNPWLKFFAEYEPLATARQVRTPVLILNGATDQQVTPDQVPLLVKAFKAAGNRYITAKVLPNLNHLFVYDPDGFPGRYTELKSFAVDRPTIGLVVEWLVKQMTKPTA